MACISQRGEFQSGHRWNLGVALRHHPGDLRSRLDEQHAGENRVAGKVAAQKRLVAANLVFAFAALSRNQIQQPVNEPEFRAMRQKAQGMMQIVGGIHWASG